jgi:hypothetical protein
MGGPDDGGMERTSGQTGDLVEVVRVLVLMQGAILVATTIEAALFSVAFGPAAGPAVLLTGGAAVLTLATSRGLGRRRRWARRLTVGAECAVLAGALLELALSLLLAGAAFGVVPTLTRLVVPIIVIVLLREPVARESFGSTTAPSPAIWGPVR